MNMTKAYRNSKDHITNEDFEVAECVICHAHFYHMSIDKHARICPKCDNKESEPNEEKDTSPEDC